MYCKAVQSAKMHLCTPSTHSTRAQRHNCTFFLQHTISWKFVQCSRIVLNGARYTDWHSEGKHGVLQHFIENAPKINPFAGIIRAVWHEYCCGEGKPKVTWLNTFLSAINVSWDQGRRCCRVLCIPWGNVPQGLKKSNSHCCLLCLAQPCNETSISHPDSLF